MHVGEQIRKIRLERNLKQADLATETNISRVSIGNYERGDRVPNADALKAIANALGVSVNDLIYDSEKLAKEVKAIESFESLLKQYGYNFRMFSYGEEDITNEDPIYEIYLTPKESIELTKGQYEELMKELREFVDFKLHRLKKAKR